jgi:hypothetical protein
MVGILPHPADNDVPGLEPPAPDAPPPAALPAEPEAPPAVAPPLPAPPAGAPPAGAPPAGAPPAGAPPAGAPPAGAPPAGAPAAGAPAVAALPAPAEPLGELPPEPSGETSLDEQPPSEAATARDRIMIGCTRFMGSSIHACYWAPKGEAAGTASGTASMLTFSRIERERKPDSGFGILSSQVLRAKRASWSDRDKKIQPVLHTATRQSAASLLIGGWNSERASPKIRKAPPIAGAW